MVLPAFTLIIFFFETDKRKSKIFFFTFYFFAVLPSPPPSPTNFSKLKQKPSWLVFSFATKSSEYLPLSHRSLQLISVAHSSLWWSSAYDTQNKSDKISDGTAHLWSPTKSSIDQHISAAKHRLKALLGVVLHFIFASAVVSVASTSLKPTSSVQLSFLQLRSLYFCILLDLAQNL